MTHYRLLCSYECHPFLTNVSSHFIREKMLKILKQLSVFKTEFPNFGSLVEIKEAQKIVIKGLLYSRDQNFRFLGLQRSIPAFSCRRPVFLNL